MENKFEQFDYVEYNHLGKKYYLPANGIYIKINDMTICHRMFDAKVFPPKIRYTVDIRPHIKRLLTSLTEIFSSNELSYEYAEVKLDV